MRLCDTAPLKATHRLVSAFILFIAVTIFSFKVNAQQNQMKFHGIPPNPKLEFITGNSWTIFADGEIDARTAQQFEKFLSENKVAFRSSLYLNSNGGSSLGGVALGRVIRKWNLITSVGRHEPKTSQKPFDIAYTVQPGHCYSACATAFLGGLFRYDTARTKSFYGVHRFSSAQQSPEAVEIAQIVSAAQTKYIRDMGVSPEFFEKKSLVAASDLEILTPSEMIRLNVANNGITKVVWSLNHIDESIYLKGERESIFGVNKVIFYCARKRLGLHIIFDPLGRENEVLRNSLEKISFDGQSIDFRPKRIGQKEVINGWINISYALNTSDLDLFEGAEKFGFYSTFSDESPTFLGFDVFPLAEGRGQLRAIRSTCS
jgi:hypothetical protein